MDITCSAEKWEEDLKGHYGSVIMCPVSKRISQLVFQAVIRLLFFFLHFAENDSLMMRLSTFYFTKNRLGAEISPIKFEVLQAWEDVQANERSTQ